MKKNYVWVIEYQPEPGARWMATEGCFFSKDDANSYIRHNYDLFRKEYRATIYIAAPEKKKCAKKK